MAGLSGAICAALVIFGTVGGVGAATAASDHPTVRLTDGTTADGNTTVGVVLTSAPDGLAGYTVDVAVGAPDGARVVDASYPAAFGLTSDPEYSDGAETVTLEAVDLHDAIRPGATAIRLATVTVENAEFDALDLTVEPGQFDADDGSAIEPDTGDTSNSDGSTDSKNNGGPADGESSGGTGDRRSGASGSGDTTVGDGGGSDRDDTGGAGGNDTTSDTPSNQGMPTAPATGAGFQPTPATAGSGDSAGESDTAVSSDGARTESVELSSLSLLPLVAAGLLVVLLVGLVRLRGRA